MILRGVFRGSKAISLLLDFPVGVSLSDDLIFVEALLVSSCSLQHSLVFFSLVASFFWSFNTHTFSPSWNERH